ncbi:MAG: TadE/TadG family type IV pilus assembly protein [Phenylobacterium sp.]|nr:TadE/TadG family type IV pilus assembly protein [Phenylobacterium sp.]
MIGFLRRAAGNERGAAAIEFALIFPVIFVLNIAAAEAFQVYQVQRNVAHIAATMADITAQARTVTDDELQDILRASTSMIYPFPASRLQQRVSSMSANHSGSVSVDWTAKRDFSTAGSPTVPSDYLSANESVIVTDVIYDYEPSFGLFLPETIRFSRKAYSRPRLTLKVDRVSD